MVRLFSALFVAIMFAAPASALQQFEEYRIVGSEILSVRLGRQEVEDPATLIIELVTESSESQEISIESDGGLDDCKLTIEYTIGDKGRYIQIRVHTTADTMNGVIVTECSTVSIPNY